MRIAHARLADGEVLPPDVWGSCVADVLALAPRGPSRINSGHREVVTWPGLDLLSLRRQLAEIGIYPDDETLTRHIANSRLRERPTISRELGRRLQLTVAERAEVQSYNILPIDKTRDELQRQRQANDTSRHSEVRQVPA
jgi:hypothetical protein